MTISCPTCHTRFRFPKNVAPVAITAHCSSCDATFPLKADQPSFMVQRAAPAPEMAAAAVAAGGPSSTLAMPDLPSTLPHTSDLPEAPAIADTPSMSELPPRPMDMPDMPDIPGTPEAAATAEGTDFLEATLDGADSVGQMEHVEEQAAEEESLDVVQPRKPSVVLDLLVAAVLAAAGVSSGYYLSILQDADPVAWTAAGGGVGLFLGWVIIRWIARKHERAARGEAG